MDNEGQTRTNEFSHAFPLHVEGLVRLLTVLRKEFDGDLDLLLIFSVVGERHFARRLHLDTPTYKTLGLTPVTQTPSVNAYSISEYTGIPRETARRKVAQLIARGWVVCDEKGNLSPTAKAAQDLTNGTDATIRFVNSLSALDGPLQTDG